MQLLDTRPSICLRYSSQLQTSLTQKTSHPVNLPFPNPLARYLVGKDTRKFPAFRMHEEHHIPHISPRHDLALKIGNYNLKAIVNAIVESLMTFSVS